MLLVVEREERITIVALGGEAMDNSAEIQRVDREQPMPSATAGWYAVTVLCVALLLSYTDRFIINLIVNPIRADLNLTDIQISLLQGVGFAVIFALAGLPCGRLGRSRQPPKPHRMWRIALVGGHDRL